ncbi:uncharacterized protein ACMZJ9_017549 [Mantella aurantiaca]
MLLKINVLLLLLLCSATMALEKCLNDESYFLNQEPKMLQLSPGETATINCTVLSPKPMNHVYLRKRFRKIMNIMTDRFQVSPGYENRLTCTGQKPHFTIMLKNLTDEDSDLYICDGMVGEFEEIHGQGTLILVRKEEVIKEEHEIAKAYNPMNPVIIVAAASCLFIFLAIFVYVRYKTLKKKKGNQNTYMDMTQTLRRNTMQSANVYCHQ